MRYDLLGGCALTLLIVGALSGAPTGEAPATIKPVKGILPSGLGEDVDRDIARARAATAKFRNPEAAVAAGYPATSHCVENQPTGGMGLHFGHPALQDATLDVEKPEILVYEKLGDGSIRLNGVEYVVPIAQWTSDQPPTLMGQPFKRANGLGIWYLHAWIWKPSSSGIFADWNPDVKCR
ncbi:MAG: hypothetical protein ABIT71_11740 [Vicinamibacteraceae bacterium]